MATATKKKATKKVEKPSSNGKPAEKVLILRTCAANMKSYNGVGAHV